MSELIYVDTNVWLDYLMNRNQGILSPALLFEIEKYVTKEQVEELLIWLEPKLLSINSNITELKSAKKLPIHYPDCIHLFLSKKYDAILVSNDRELQELGAISSHTL